jgi:hypothetical protein
MSFVEWNQEVETLPAKAAAESLTHRVRLRGSHRRPQNPYTQIGKALVDFVGEDAVSIVDEESPGNASRSASNMPDSVSGGSYWCLFARSFGSLGPPLRPCGEDLEVVRGAVAEATARRPGHPMRALLLGVTPELSVIDRGSPRPGLVE